jgi:hypothetical protein
MGHAEQKQLELLMIELKGKERRRKARSPRLLDKKSQIREKRKKICGWSAKI